MLTHAPGDAIQVHKLLIYIYKFIYVSLNKYLYILVWFEVWYKDRNEVFRVSQFPENSTGEIRKNSVKEKTAF